MKSELLHRNILVKKSPVHGYGVFANQVFDTGDIIEECYTLISKEEIYQLSNYVFSVENKTGVPLGNAMIYNHSNLPNMYHEYDAERAVLVFRALRPIRRGEELFHSYGKSWFSGRKMNVKQPSLLFRLRQTRVLPFLKLLLRFAIVVFVLVSVITIMKAFLLVLR
jgi:hypothetical protein